MVDSFFGIKTDLLVGALVGVGLSWLIICLRSSTKSDACGCEFVSARNSPEILKVEPHSISADEAFRSGFHTILKPRRTIVRAFLQEGQSNELSMVFKLP